MNAIIKRAEARNDLVHHGLHLFNHNPSAADRFIEMVQATLERLASRPGIGQPCRYTEAELASVRRSTVDGFRNYLIYYQAIPGGIEVLRVVHAAQDQSSIFGSDEPLRGNFSLAPRTRSPHAP